MSAIEVSATLVNTVHRPTVLLKLAASLDGFIGGVGRERVIFSDAADREAVLRCRRRADAILIGGATLRRDDPTLRTVDNDSTVNNDSTLNNDSAAPGPLRVVLTAQGEIPPAARLFHSSAPVLVCCPATRRASLAATLGPRIDLFGYESASESVREVLAELSRRGVTRVLVEGGMEVAGALLAARSVDLLRIAFAPLFLGPEGGKSLVSSSGHLPGLASPMSLCLVEQVGRMLVGWFEPEWARKGTLNEWSDLPFT